MRMLDAKPRVLVLGAVALLSGACSGTGAEPAGSSAQDLSGCHGRASSSQSASGDYGLTSFGGGSDTQSMACGGTADGTWYYAASSQRFGCGARLQVEANGACVVVATEDYGPDVCVERAAGRAILDASPLVAEALFGASSAGWSDGLVVHVTEVSRSTPLGACSGGSSGGGGSGGGGSSGGCWSHTLGAQVPENACVQSASDSNWYQCAAGQWVDRWSDPNACVAEYPL